MTSISEAIGVSIDEVLFGEYSRDDSLRALEKILKDCSEYERKVLCDNMKTLKRILRDSDRHKAVVIGYSKDKAGPVGSAFNNAYR